MSESYQKAFRVVRNIINYVDPESLEPGKPDGSPIDEYEMEVAQITSYLLNHLNQINSDPKFLSKEIDRVWTQSFDRECPASEYLAKEIIRKVSCKLFRI